MEPRPPAGRVDPASLKRRLHGALALNASIVAAEVVVGLRVRSVGLLSDAGHNFIDQGALFLTLYAHLLSLRPASDRRTFGYHRAGIVTAFLNAFVLLLTAAFLAGLALERLVSPVAVQGGWVVAAALISFLANLGIALLLQRDSESDLNIRSAFWHMLGDAWVSFGVVAGGAAIALTHWFVLDSIVSLVIVAVIVRGAWNVFKESMEILMEAAPPSVALPALVAELQGIPGVGKVHDLHVWTIKQGVSALSCHVTSEGSAERPREGLLNEIRGRVMSKFRIKHVTVQLETRCRRPDQLHCDLNEAEEPAAAP